MVHLGLRFLIGVKRFVYAFFQPQFFYILRFKNVGYKGSEFQKKAVNKALRSLGFESASYFIRTVNDRSLFDAENTKHIGSCGIFSVLCLSLFSFALVRVPPSLSLSSSLPYFIPQDPKNCRNFGPNGNPPLVWSREETLKWEVSARKAWVRRERKHSSKAS